MREYCVANAVMPDDPAHIAALKRWKWREYTGTEVDCRGTVLSPEDARSIERVGIFQQEKIDRNLAIEAAKRADEKAAKEQWLRQQQKPQVRIGMSEQ